MLGAIAVPPTRFHMVACGKPKTIAVSHNLIDNDPNLKSENISHFHASPLTVSSASASDQWRGMA
jgi:hypothetical protein